MGKHLIQGPDGRKHIIEAPDDARPEDIEAFANQQFAPSRAESLGRGALQGVTFGFGDEIYGAAKGAYDKVFGDGDFGGTYERERNAVRAANDAAQQANPGTYLAGELVGGVGVPLGAAKLGYKGVQAANAGLKARTAAAAKEGAAIGGLYGLGKGEGDFGDQAISTASGAAMGGAFGAAVPGAVQLASAVARAPAQAVRMMQSPEKVAAQKYAEAMGRDAGVEGMSPILNNPNAMRAAQSGVDGAGGRAMLADFGGENTRNLTRAAVNMPNARAERYNQVLNRRQKLAPKDLERSIGENLGDGAGLYDDIDKIVAQRDKLAEPMFRAAFAIETPMTQQLSRVLQRPTMVELQKQVNRRLADEDMPIGLMSRSEQLHRMKLELDEQIGMSIRAEKMGNRPTQGWDTRTLTILKHDLLNAIDNKAYKYALQKYAGPSALKNAAEDGADEALKLAPEQIRGKLAKLTRSEQEMWRQGAARSLIDEVRSGNFMRDRTKSIFDTPDMQLRLKQIFPDNKSRGQFLRTVAQKRREAMTRQAAQGNSTTAKQLINAQEAGKNIRTAADVAAAASGKPGAIVSALERGANLLSGLTPGVAAEVLNLAMTKTGGRAGGLSNQAIREAYEQVQARIARQGQATNALVPAEAVLSSEFGQRSSPAQR